MSVITNGNEIPDAVKRDRGKRGRPFTSTRQPKRKRGAARVTRDLKQGVIDAAVRHGSNGKGKDGLTGYLTFLAAEQPRSFAQLLCKLMPYHFSTHKLTHAVKQVNVVALPSASFVDPAGNRIAPPMIEHEESHTETVATAGDDGDDAD